MLRIGIFICLLLIVLAFFNFPFDLVGSYIENGLDMAYSYGPKILLLIALAWGSEIAICYIESGKNK